MADHDHGIPNCVVTTSNELYAVNGRLARGYEMTISPEVFEQYRLGYRCVACHHFPQPQAFPDRCCEPYCRFPIRDRQLDQLAFEDRGESELLPDRHATSAIDVFDDSIWLPGRPL